LDQFDEAEKDIIRKLADIFLGNKG